MFFCVALWHDTGCPNQKTLKKHIGMVKNPPLVVKNPFRTKTNYPSPFLIASRICQLHGASLEELQTFITNQHITHRFRKCNIATDDLAQDVVNHQNHTTIIDVPFFYRINRHLQTRQEYIVGRIEIQSFCLNQILLYVLLYGKLQCVYGK